MSTHAHNHRAGEHARAQHEASNKTDDHQGVGSTCSRISALCPQSLKLHLTNSRLFGHPKLMFTSKLRFKSLKCDLQMLGGEVRPLHRYL
ncbi:hypothetical protein ABZS68_13935 [Streptomyces sp. NPDC005571]|uniref:hypothetical protein n=1 Tax=Streptomyces sp. NPDC005571 TaxID=3156888 RepID=UPI0033B3382E